MDLLAGIDLGSTSIKCVILDLKVDVVLCRTRQKGNPERD